MPQTTTRPASDKQTALIARLAREKDIRHLDHEDRLLIALADDPGEGDGIQMREASRLIDLLFACPREAADLSTMAAPGYYVTSGEESDGEVPPTVYVVVENRAKTATYAKRLEVTRNEGGRNTARWEYAPGAGKNLAAEGLHPLGVKEAARLGHLHGVCVVCARGLTDPDSVMRGIGPVCAARLGGV